MLGDDAAELAALLNDLPLSRKGDDGEAGLLITSLPWPRADPIALWPGGSPSSALALGQWPETTYPRRLLLTADLPSGSPRQIALLTGGTSQEVERPMPTAELELLERSSEPLYMWERHLLRIRWQDRTVGLALGLRTGGEVHWWEACRLVVLERTNHCLVIEVAGAIPHHDVPLSEHRRLQRYGNPYLHKHNWLNGHIYARLHDNGVCEVFAHHTNSKFFDDGLALEDVVPVIGVAADPVDAPQLSGLWDGTQPLISVGDVRFDFSEMARLATISQPGEMSWHKGLFVLQPYAGVELFGGLCPQAQKGDPFIFRAEEKVFPRGMSRTLRFSMSLSERPPSVARYLAPAWWYGLCEEFIPDALLPVTPRDDLPLSASRSWLRQHMVRGGFEDGSLPRFSANAWDLPERPRYEPGWEGEVPYAQLLDAWRTGDTDDHADALRAAYYFTDVVVDHAAKLVRMVGYPPHTFALPMNRMHVLWGDIWKLGIPTCCEPPRL